MLQSIKDTLARLWAAIKSYGLTFWLIMGLLFAAAGLEAKNNYDTRAGLADLRSRIEKLEAKQPKAIPSVKPRGKG